MKTTHSEAQHWWSNLSRGERRLICTLARMLKDAKRSHIKELIRATAHWESGIGCFLKLRIIHQRPFRLAPKSPWLRIEGKSSPPKKPNPKPALPLRWNDTYIPRRRDLCRKSSANRNSKIEIQKFPKSL